MICQHCKENTDSLHYFFSILLDPRLSREQAIDMILKTCVHKTHTIKYVDIEIKEGMEVIKNKLPE